VLKKIHHINFVVRDLVAAVQQYQYLLGLKFEYIEEHPERPVKTARCKLGDTWLVLIQPMDNKSVPGKYLTKNGEGLFLISYEVENVVKQIDEINRKGDHMTDQQPRTGISNWQVADLKTDSMFGALTQICEEKS
jgi:methylmalonyl-CoA/ethylmalonyl-CoA epimerase